MMSRSVSWTEQSEWKYFIGMGSKRDAEFRIQSQARPSLINLFRVHQDFIFFSSYFYNRSNFKHYALQRLFFYDSVVKFWSWFGLITWAINYKLCLCASAVFSNFFFSNRIFFHLHWKMSNKFHYFVGTQSIVLCCYTKKLHCTSSFFLHE